MSSLKKETLFGATAEIAVHGYVRDNFDKKCWIEEIVAIIIQFYMTKGGSLHVCGAGEYGCLGIEKYKNKTCKTLTLCPPFTNNNALKVSASEYHTLILDIEGDVWCCGYGNWGNLDNGKVDCVYVPIKLNLGTRVIEVSAGGWHSLFLCENGTVKGCGSNKGGQIGLGDLEKTLVPKTIEALKKYKITRICAGSYHSAALTEDGVLFCFGDNRQGQCGVGKEKGEKIKTPNKIDLDDEIEFVECGDYHTLIISRKGLMYSFGYGNYYRLGHGDATEKYVPTLVDALKEKRMRICAAGSRHSLCIDEEGIIWSFGRNKEGQCGLSADIEIQKTPKVITWFIKNEIKAEECAAGGYQSSVITHDGHLYVFGDSEEYELGLEDPKAYFQPTEVPLSRKMMVQSVSMGLRYTTAIMRAAV